MKLNKSEIMALKNKSKETKKDVFKNLVQDIEEEIMRKNPSFMQFLAIEKQIRKKLEEGFMKTTLWNFLKKEGILDVSYPVFCQYLRDTEINTDLEKKPRKLKTKKTQQEMETEAIQEITPKTIETEPEKEQTTQQPETIQVVEGEKSETLKRIEEHRQRVQAQRAAEATTEIKPEQQTKINVQQETPETEEREFGQLPKGKIWSELPEDLKDIIRKERQEISNKERAERRERSRQEAISGIHYKANQMHHDPNPKPPGYWKK